MNRPLFHAWALLALTIGSVGCPVSASPAGDLYEALGGQQGVTAIASDLIDRAVADPRLRDQFRGSNLRRIKSSLAEQLCELSGGPCHYAGDSMREVHAGHHITSAQFNGLVEDLQVVLKARHVGTSARNRLIALLAPMRRDVVNVAPEGGP